MAVLVYSLYNLSRQALMVDHKIVGFFLVSEPIPFKAFASSNTF